MNLNVILFVSILLIVFNSSFKPIRAEKNNLDETVVKKLDIKSDSASLDNKVNLENSSSNKLNISDRSLKNISDKLSKDEENNELNSKKIMERETKPDKKETKDNLLNNKLVSADQNTGITSSNQNGNKNKKHNTDTKENINSKQEIKKLEEEKELVKPIGGRIDVSADDLPSFDEWKKKVVEEEPNNQQSLNNINSSNKKLFQNSIKGNKLRIRNYASSECGAKVINSNKEAQGSYKVLSESQDEYMLNPCNTKIWFIIELCEAIKLSSIEVANYELFSSTFRDFLIYGSGHYPTRDWQLIGNFTANDIKQVQVFQFFEETEFRKFIKIEILSHHGSEHFCPFSLVRAFGTSMTDEFDALEDKIMPIDEEQVLEKNKLSENSTEKNYLNEKSVFYKILVKVAEFFYKNLPERERKDTKEENFAKFLRDRDTLDAIIEQSVMNMMPTLEPKLKICLNLDQLESKKKRYKRIRLCNYLRTLVGATTFDLLLKEINKDRGLQFKCLFNSNSIDNLTLNEKDQLNLTTNHLLKSSKLESSMLDQKFNSNKLVLEKNLNEEINLNNDASITNLKKITSSILDASKRDPMPTPTNVIKNLDSASPTISSLELLDEKINDLTKKASDKLSDLEDEKLNIQSPESDNQQPIKIKSNNKEIDRTIAEKENTSSSVDDQQIKPTEKLSTSEPIRTTKTIHPADDELPPNGQPLSGSASKETIFIRMINKIKTLELNLSLSSQYLEELSQRYRRQMDEMQKNFNQTIFKLNETSKNAAEKDERQQLLLDKLSSKISELEEKLYILIAIITAKFIVSLIYWYLN